MMRNPRAYAGGLRSGDGGEFLCGKDRWPANPRHLIPTAFFHVVRLWLRCRAESGGLSSLPEPGGVNDQPAWLMAAFDTLAAAEADARSGERDD